MIFWRLFLALAALPLRLYRTRRPESGPFAPRILIIRRNRLGDMLCTLPFIRIIRLHHSKAHITVACDPPGEAVARACEAVDEVIVLERGWHRSQAAFKNARRLQDFDWVIAAKGGFDRRLAFLARLTNSKVRIGFAPHPERPSAYFTDPVALPENPFTEHQIETIFRLSSGLGLSRLVFEPRALRITVPEKARAFAQELLGVPPFISFPRFILINLSSTVRSRFQPEDRKELICRLLAETKFAIGLVFAPHDRATADELAADLASERVVVLPTPGPLELAALLERCVFFITPEGGAGHLAAAVKATPTLVLWSEGPFEKWHSRGIRQTFVRLEPGAKYLTLDQVWNALQPYLALPIRR